MRVGRLFQERCWRLRLRLVKTWRGGASEGSIAPLHAWFMAYLFPFATCVGGGFNKRILMGSFGPKWLILDPWIHTNAPLIAPTPRLYATSTFTKKSGKIRKVLLISFSPNELWQVPRRWQHALPDWKSIGLWLLIAFKGTLTIT